MTQAEPQLLAVICLKHRRMIHKRSISTIVLSNFTGSPWFLAHRSLPIRWNKGPASRCTCNLYEKHYLSEVARSSLHLAAWQKSWIDHTGDQPLGYLKIPRHVSSWKNIEKINQCKKYCKMASLQWLQCPSVLRKQTIRIACNVQRRGLDLGALRLSSPI